LIVSDARGIASDLNLPTPTEVGRALANLGNYRVLRVQEITWPYKPIPASVMLGIGFRESELKNVCGGAVLVNGVWVKSFSDRGYLQISDQFEADFLKTAEGCAEGQWGPTNPPSTAIEPRHVPRFTPATHYVKQTLINSMEYAHTQGVPDSELLRFAIAAHNAGDGGAIAGWREGDVDKHTAHGDYSAYVLALQPAIHAWITDPLHSHWVYRHPAIDY
jgi:hypothetical protein